jgi:excisionase family DNA binding protein
MRTDSTDKTNFGGSSVLGDPHNTSHNSSDMRLNRRFGQDRSTTLQLFENQLLSYKQAAQYLSVSEAYLRKLKARGEIPYVLVGDRAVRFRVSSLNQWVEKREVK